MVTDFIPMCVSEEEAIFSRDFTDSTGQLNRDIQSLAELNGDVFEQRPRVADQRDRADGGGKRFDARHPTHDWCER